MNSENRKEVEVSCGRQMRVARALLGLDKKKVASDLQISLGHLAAIEANEGVAKTETLMTLHQYYESRGGCFVEGGDVVEGVTAYLDEGN